MHVTRFIIVRKKIHASVSVTRFIMFFLN